MQQQPIRYGVALSGGGARGIMHLGVLQAFNDLGFRVDALSGTSMGAIVGAFYALGVEPIDVLRLIETKARKKRIFHFSSLHRPDTGFFEMTLVKENLLKYAQYDDFNALSIPFYVSVSNLTTGKNELINSGPFIDYVIASASIPIIFEAKKINGHFYVDGGLTKNLAARILNNKMDKVIGIHSNHILPNKNIHNIRDVAERCFQLSVFNTIRNELSYCDFLIDPPAVRKYSTFDFDDAEAIYEIGYHEGISFLKNNRLI